MDSIQRQLFNIIRNSFRQEKQILEESVDWGSICRIAKAARIVPLISMGMRPDQPIAPEAQKELLQITYQSMMVSQRQSAVVSGLERLFRENGIDYMLLKGAVLKKLYPQPQMRPMGDVDVLIRMEQYDKIRALLLQEGFAEGKETDHELLWCKKPHVLIELHKQLMPTYDEDYYRYFGNGWKFAQPLDASGKYGMSPEHTLIYIFTHFAKHYRSGGIGIRHLVDLWVYRRAYPELDREAVLRELKKLRLDTFYRNVQATLDACFEGAPETPVTDCIINWVFESKVYGDVEKSDDANALRGTKQSGSVAQARRKSFWQQVFLPLWMMRQKYPVLKRLPVLLPVMWVVRWVDALLHKRENIQYQQKRLKAFDPQTVRQYQAKLNFVGLDFDF